MYDVSFLFGEFVGNGEQELEFFWGVAHKEYVVCTGWGCYKERADVASTMASAEETKDCLNEVFIVLGAEDFSLANTLGDTKWCAKISVQSYLELAVFQ